MINNEPEGPSGQYKRQKERGFLGSFINFDELIGAGLVKFNYYIGLIVIVYFAGKFALSGNFPAPLSFLIPLPIVGLAIFSWRIACELSLLAFLSYKRLGEVRDRLPSR